MKTKNNSCLLEAISPDTIARAAEMLRTMSHPMRLQIVDVLNTMGARPVCEITDYLGIAQATTSQHLNHMRRVGLLRSERRGKENWYSIADERPIALLDCICRCCQSTN